MDKENKIIRRYKKRLRCEQKKMSFDLNVLRREIHEIQNGDIIRNSFIEDFSTKSEGMRNE